MFSLITKLMMPHKKKIERKPARKARPGPSGINAITKKATNAMLHHGRNRQATKLRNAMRRRFIMSFILVERLNLGEKYKV